MSIVLYRFDNVDKFPVLESKTTTRGPVAMDVDPPSASGDPPGLRIVVPRQPAEVVEPTVVLTLPVRAIDGKPRHFLLAVCGDASGCRVWLEGTDATGMGLAYTFGTVRFTGWRICTADAAQPEEHGSGREHEAAPAVTSPLHFHRLGFALGANEKGMDIRLRTLGASGDVRLAVPGIA